MSTEAAATPLTAEGVLAALDRNGVTDVVWLPDTESGFMYHAMARRETPRLTPVCREGEAPAVAYGLMVAGRKPVVIIQSTGFFESGDSIRGLGLAMNMPLVMLLGYRGWMGGAPMKDTAAIYLEPMLEAWGIPYFLVESDRDLGNVDAAWRVAEERRGMAAVLIGQEYE